MHGLIAALAALGCTSPDSSHEVSPLPEARESHAAAATPPNTALAGTPDPSVSARYPWLSDPSIKLPRAAEPLRTRFPPPPDFTRVPLDPASFGAFLRDLPLSPPEAPVLSYRGKPILPADHPHLAAVVALDIGTADLQHCADSIIRLHAEWLWSIGHRDFTYHAGSGTPLPFERFLRGERPVLRGQSLLWEPRTQKAETPVDHASFRRYLDHVFTWANTGSLAVQAKKIGVDVLRPGDFVIQPGAPGHAVIVLDMATSAAGQRRALLGQGFMPAQHFHVLRPGPESPWFSIPARTPAEPQEPARPAKGKSGLKTPFWPIFGWETLRRLDAPS